MVSVVFVFVIVLLLYLLATLAKFSLPLFFFSVIPSLVFCVASIPPCSFSVHKGVPSHKVARGHAIVWRSQPQALPQLQCKGLVTHMVCTCSSLLLTHHNYYSFLWIMLVAAIQYITD